MKGRFKLNISGEGFQVFLDGTQISRLFEVSRIKKVWPAGHFLINFVDLLRWKSTG